MMMKMKRGRGQEGIALVITLLIMTILLVMGTAFMSISSTETLIAINERNRVQAYHLAEAAAEMAIAQLSVDAAYVGTPVGADPSLGPGTYRVTVTCVPTGAPPCPVPNPNQRLISAMGCVRNCTPPSATSRVEVRVQPGSPFRFAAYGLGVTGLQDGVLMDSYDSALGNYPSGPASQANIGSNGNIVIWTGSTVKGNAQAVGTVTLGAGSTIQGTTTTPAPSVTFPTVDTSPQGPPSSAGIDPPAAYDPATRNLTLTPGSTVRLSGGTYYFNQVKIGTSGGGGAILDITGPVVIYMTGPFQAYGGSMINATAASTRMPGDLVIFSSKAGEDAVKGWDGGGQFRGAIYARDAEVEFSAGWAVYGAAIGDQIDIEDGVQFHYDLALGRSPTPGWPFRPTAGSWQERLPSS